MAAIARVEDNVDVYDPEKYPWCWYGCSNGLKSKMNWKYRISVSLFDEYL